MELDQLPMDPFQKADPASLINRVSPGTGRAFIEAHKREPDLFGLDERDLYQKLRLSNRLPSPTDNQLRISFWM